jgi:heterodisulfide reductase subunit B
MIQVGYYPGCALHGTAAEFDGSLRAVCQAMEITLTELADWNCCGASSAHFLDEQLALDLAERNLRLALQVGPELLAPCAACFHRLKTAQKQRPGYEVHIWHVNEFFARPEGLARLRGRVQRPLRGLACVPYYGCLTQRQPKITDAERPEWPTSMDMLLETLGAKVRRWSYKTDCCGGSLEVARPDLVQHLCTRLVRAAQEAGADCIVTACPMCQANLDISQASPSAPGEPDRRSAVRDSTAKPEAKPAEAAAWPLPTEGEEGLGQAEPAGGGVNAPLPVFYITELMALALGVGTPARWWHRHMVDPRPLLKQKGFPTE